MPKNKPKKEADKFERNDHTFRDNWIKRALKEIKFLEVKHVKTSKENETEPILLFRKKKIMQLAHSSVAYFSAYCFSPGKINIIKVTDDETSQLAYGWLIDRVQVLENGITEKPTKPRTKKMPKTESVEDLEKRIENMSADAKGIHISKPTDDILSWVESSKIVGGNTLFVRGL